jgi:PKD repeat protein
VFYIIDMNNLRILVLVSFFTLKQINAVSQPFVEIETNITPFSWGEMTWGDYNNDNLLDVAITGLNSNERGIAFIYMNEGNNSFAEQSEIFIENLYWSSNAWGDYDNDGDLDIIVAGLYSHYAILYKNNGDNTFTDLEQTTIDNIYDGDLDWGDYDNDGDLDILISGNNLAEEYITKIYKNNGNETFIEQTGINLVKTKYSSVDWGDFNNDSYLDILISGESRTGFVSKIYKNNGNNTFSEHSNVDLHPAKRGNIVWGDYNSDGLLDILLIGNIDDEYESSLTKIYKNLDGNIFEEQTQPELNSGNHGTGAWGDYDNDGDLDIILSGCCDENGFKTSVYQNVDNYYIEQTEIDLIGTIDCSTGWTDYDNDGDLDIYISGESWTYGKYIDGFVTKIYKNETEQKNTKPEPPINLSNEINGNSVILNWNKANDNETPQDGLTYNLIITKIDNDSIIKSPMSNLSDGFRKIISKGEINKNSWTVKNLGSGEYSWRVQTIDNSFAGSQFSEEKTFTIFFDNEIAPSNAQVVLPNNNGNTITVSETQTVDSRQWKYSKHPGGPYIYEISGANEVNYVPNFSENGTFYVVCISNKDGASIVSNEVKIDVPYFSEKLENPFPGVYEGHVDLGDFDNDGDLDLLLTGNSGNNDEPSPITEIYINIGNNEFEKLEGLDLIGIYQSSVEWGDYNGDEYLDILMTGNNQDNPVSKVYKNNGDNSFSELVDINLKGVYNGDAAWGDYDNDGDLDIILTGSTLDNQELLLYKNNNNNGFEEVKLNIEPIFDGDISWGDYDNDNDLDLLIIGRNYSGNSMTKIYKNEGNDIFNDIDADLLNLSSSSCAWGDYDNDGDLDILINGFNQIERISTRVYKNNGDDTFTILTEIPITDTDNGSLAWGDYDNDGDLDIIITGMDNSFSNCVAKIFINNGDGNFEENKNITLDGVMESSVTWGDTDNDQDLDLIINGRTSHGEDSGIIKMYINNCIKSNNPPTPPTILSSSVAGDIVSLCWAKSTDAETVSEALTYNISISKFQDSTKTISPMADENSGYHRVVGTGNALFDSSYYVTKLDTGKYYWRVQAIDNSYMGSAFSFVDSFNILPTYTAIETNLIGVVYGSVAWGDYDNDDDLDIILSGYADNTGPITKIYRNIGDNNFEEQKHIDLQGIESGDITWGDYNNDGNLDILITGYGYNWDQGIAKGYSIIYQNNGDNTFTEQDQITLQGVYNSSVAWGDYDNDGYLDILLCGEIEYKNYITKVYKNTGNNNFVEQTSINLPHIIGGDGVWCDLDNDGDLDIILSGHHLDGVFIGIFDVYRNDGNNSFVKQVGFEFKNIYANSIDLGDYDNDGDFDVLVSGNDSDFNKITKIFRNDSFENFTDINAFIRGADYGNSMWGDFDNDGDLDILLSGVSGVEITSVYRNEGNNIFTELDFEIEGTISGESEWADYDNDGDLDILLTSSKYGGSISKIYRNNGNWKNLVPNKPINLWSSRKDTGILLSWEEAEDDLTSSQALTYNIRIGTVPNGIDIVSPMSNSLNGYLKNPQERNAQLNKQYYINGLNIGTYYWSVQAIDQSFMGGEWGEEQTFTISVVQSNFLTDTVCQNDTIHFVDLSVSGNSEITSWYWDFGDDFTSTDQNPTHVYVESGNFEVTLIAGNNEFSDTITKTVVVKPIPIISFSTNTVCLGNETRIFNTTNTDENNIHSWSWDFGDGNTSINQNPVGHTYFTPGTYEISLKAIAVNGCSDSISNEALVGEYPNPAISMIGNNSICDGDSTILQTEYNSDYKYNWKLNGANLSYADTNIYVAKVAGSYTVKVTNNIGRCETTSPSIEITVKESPLNYEIFFDGDTSFCFGDSVLLYTENNANYNYNWKLDNYFIPNANSYKYIAQQTGAYSVVISDTNSCSTETNFLKVSTKAIPGVPQITTEDDTEICYGDKVTLSVINDLEFEFQWYKNSNPITGGNEHTIDIFTPGVYSVELSKSGCSNLSSDFEIISKTDLEKPNLFAQGPDMWILACSNDSAQNYRWYYNGEIISEASDPVYIANQQLGEYYVEINDGGECYVPSDIVIIPLSATDIKALDIFGHIKIYPNPTPGTFTIEMDNEIIGTLYIRINNANARELFNIKHNKTTRHFQTQMDLSGQGKGMYFIEFRFEDDKTVRKLMVE